MKAEHYIKYITLLLIGIAFAVVSCKEEEKADLLELSLDKNNIVLQVGMTETLNVVPDIDVEWTTTNPGVVTVENGVVTAVGLGNAKINAKSGRSLVFCEVSVIDEPVDVTGVTVSIADTVLAVGSQFTLVSVVLPDSATYKNVIWSSSDPSVVAIDDLTGEVTALALGQATITVTTVDGEKTAESVINVWPSLLLNRPFDNSSVMLNPVEPGKTMSFSWIPFEGTTDYILKVSTTGEMDQVILEREVSGSSVAIPEYEFNELIKGNAGAGKVTLYWSVQPGDPIDVIGEIRTLDILPDRHLYFNLVPETAINGTVTEGEGAYHYTLSAGAGESSLFTTVLENSIPSDSVMFSLLYTSNQPLASLDVVFFKADGTEAGTLVTPELPQSAEWNELAFAAYQAFTAYSWGEPGDYLRLDFNEAWQGQLNGIHFRGMTPQEQKETYVPQILSITGSNHSVLTPQSETHYSVLTTGTDPFLNTSSLNADLPPGANTLSFEYKSAQVMSNNLQIFLITPSQGPAESRSFKLGSVNPATDWTVYEVDLTPAIEGWDWGVAGSRMRIDIGEKPDYAMEIRNIQVVYKD